MQRVPGRMAYPAGKVRGIERWKLERNIPRGVLSCFHLPYTNHNGFKSFSRQIKQNFATVSPTEVWLSDPLLLSWCLLLQSWHLLTPSDPLVPQSDHTVKVWTLVHFVVKHSRPPELNTIRRNLLTCCNFVSIRKNVVFYVFGTINVLVNLFS